MLKNLVLIGSGIFKKDSFLGWIKLEHIQKLEQYIQKLEHLKQLDERKWREHDHKKWLEEFGKSCKNCVHEDCAMRVETGRFYCSAWKRQIDKYCKTCRESDVCNSERNFKNAPCWESKE